MSSTDIGRDRTLTAPLPPANMHASALAPPVLLRSPAKRRILVVDDNVGAAKLLGLLIRKLGEHDVDMAHDGPTALNKARDLRPDMVLMDLGLPGMNGYEVARAIRGEPELRDMLLIALTGYDEEECRTQTHAAGFDEHIVKPASIDMISMLLRDSRLPNSRNCPISPYPKTSPSPSGRGSG